MISWLLLPSLLFAGSGRQGPPVTLGVAPEQLADAELVILHTANTAGHLKSCGCSKRDLWGLPQQAAIIERVRAQGRPTLVLDSGDLSDDPEEWNAIARSLAVMGYDALTYGALDAKAAAGRSLSLPRGVLLLTGPLQTTLVPGARPKHRVLVRPGGVRVGLVATGPPVSSTDAQRSVARLATLARDLRRDGAQLVIALSSWGAASDLLLAKESDAQIDLILGGGDWQAASAPLRIGGTTIAPTAQGGKALSLLTARDVASGEPTWTYLRIPTSLAEGADADVARIIGDHLADDARRQASAAPRERDANATYVRADECSTCHPDEYRKWTSHKHARALEPLRREARVLSECLGCHSEHYRRNGSFPASERRRGREGVECSACHGDGLLHSVDPRSAPVAIPRDGRVCLDCHTQERSPDYELPTYLKRIAH